AVVPRQNGSRLPGAVLPVVVTRDVSEVHGKPSCRQPHGIRCFSRCVANGELKAIAFRGHDVPRKQHIAAFCEPVEGGYGGFVVTAIESLLKELLLECSLIQEPLCFGVCAFNLR